MHVASHTDMGVVHAAHEIVDEIYNVPGAVFVKDLETYVVPCDTKANVSISFR